MKLPEDEHETIMALGRFIEYYDEGVYLWSRLDFTDRSLSKETVDAVFPHHAKATIDKAFGPEYAKLLYGLAPCLAINSGVKDDLHVYFKEESAAVAFIGLLDLKAIAPIRHFSGHDMYRHGVCR